MTSGMSSLHENSKHTIVDSRVRLGVEDAQQDQASSAYDREDDSEYTEDLFCLVVVWRKAVLVS